MQLLPVLGLGLNLQTFVILSVATQLPSLTIKASVSAVQALASLTCTMVSFARKKPDPEKFLAVPLSEISADDLQKLMFKKIDKLREEIVSAEKEETSLRLAYEKTFREARSAEAVALAADKKANENLNELAGAINRYRLSDPERGLIPNPSPETQVALPPEYVSELCPIMHTIAQLSQEIEALIVPSENSNVPAQAAAPSPDAQLQEKMSKLDAIRIARQEVQKINDKLFMAQFRELQETIKAMSTKEKELVRSIQAVESAFSHREEQARQIFRELHELNAAVPPDPSASSPTTEESKKTKKGGFFAFFFSSKNSEEAELKNLNVDPSFSYRILATEAQIVKEEFYHKRDSEAEALNKLNTQRFKILTLKCKKDGLEQMLTKTQVLDMLPTDLARPADPEEIDFFVQIKY